MESAENMSRSISTTTLSDTSMMFPIESLPNELVLNVFQHLHFRDLLLARLVCKQWKHLVNLPALNSDIKLKITKLNLASIRSQIEDGASFVHCPNLELVELDLLEDVYYVLDAIGQNVRRLWLQHLPILKPLHEKMPNVKQLTIKCNCRCSVGLKDEFNLNGFTKLKSLKFKSNACEDQLIVYMLEQLTRAKTCLKLEYLEIINYKKYTHIYTDIYETHAPTLKYMNVHFMSPEEPLVSMSMLQQLRQLEEITFGANVSAEMALSIFKNVPVKAPLQRVDLTSILFLSDELLHFVVHKWKSTLQRLDLLFCRRDACQRNHVRQLPLLHDNLKILKVLYSNHISGSDLAQSIASVMNYKLRVLLLVSVELLTEEELCTLSQHLPNLRELTIENCERAITNKSLSHIFQHQTRLQRLFLRDCLHVSDRGMMGYGETPYSINRLRGLRKFVLYGSPGVTNDTLCAMRLNQLETLTFGNCSNITGTGVEHLVANCPNIEVLSFTNCPTLDDDAVLHVAKGLRRLRSFTASHCQRLTPLFMEHIIKYCDSLRSLKVLGVDSLNEKEVTEGLRLALPLLRECICHNNSMKHFIK